MTVLSENDNNARDLIDRVIELYPIFEYKYWKGNTFVFLIDNLVSSRPLNFSNDNDYVTIFDDKHRLKIILNLKEKQGILRSVSSKYTNSFYRKMFDLNIAIKGCDDYIKFKRQWTIYNIIND